MPKNKTQKNIPEGWRKAEFDIVFDRIANKKYQIKSNEYLNIGKFPVVDQGKNKIIAYSNQEEKVFKNDGVIVFGDHTRIVKYIDFDFVVGADGTQLIKTKDGFSNKFFYFNILAKKIPNTGYNRHFKYLKDSIYFYPPLPEQNRIVAVLEIWDEYLEKLSRKIEIKRDIKKGIASQIMNCELSIVNGKKVYVPKLRLPGFSGDWESVKLGDVSNIKRGDMITKKDITDGYIPVIAGGQQPAYFHNKSNRKGMTITVSGSGAYAGYVDFYNCPIFVSDGMSIQEKSLDINFIYYFLKLKQDYIYSLQTGGAQPHIYPKDLQRLKLSIPKSLEEQTAIAEILTTADEEIEMLEKKKKIIEGQKKFLLNNLVTGKIRTV